MSANTETGRTRHLFFLFVSVMALVAEGAATERLTPFSTGAQPNALTGDRAYRELYRESIITGDRLDLLTNRPVGKGILDSLARGHEPEFGRAGWHLIEFKSDSGSWFQFDPYFTFRVDAGGGKSILRRGSGIRFSGAFQRKIGYFFRFVDNTERGNGSYRKRSDLLEDRAGYVGPLTGTQETYYDLTDAGICWSSMWLSATLGKERVSWGPGRLTNLLISNGGPSFDQLRLKAALSPNTRFTYLLGRIHPSVDVPSDTVYTTSDGWRRTTLANKWIAAQRLEFAPRDNLIVSVSEAVIWGERGIDPAYVNPLYFYYSAQHDGNDRDNVLLSGDFLYRFDCSAVIYGAVLIDDLKTSTIGKGNAGNKLGWLAGSFAPNCGVRGLDVGFEWVRLEPYVYTHFFPINRYTHWTSPIGADIPPNSDRITFTTDYRLPKMVLLHGEVSNSRHGTLGGDVNVPLPHRLPDNPLGPIHFLDGARRDWVSWKVSVEWEPISGGVIEAGIVRGDKAASLPNRAYLSVGYHL